MDGGVGVGGGRKNREDGGGDDNADEDKHKALFPEHVTNKASDSEPWFVGLR